MDTFKLTINCNIFGKNDITVFNTLKQLYISYEHDLKHQTTELSNINTKYYV